MYLNLFQFQGRIFVIARPKFGVLEHVGLMLPDESVMHCTPERGTHRSSAEEFAQGHDVRTVREIPSELHGTVMQRVYWIEKNPQTYDLFTRNCIDFLNWLTAPVSPRVASQPLWLK